MIRYLIVQYAETGLLIQAKNYKVPQSRDNIRYL